MPVSHCDRTAAGPNVEVLTLSLHSPTRPQPIVLDLAQPEKLKALKKDRKSPGKSAFGGAVLC